MNGQPVPRGRVGVFEKVHLECIMVCLIHFFGKVEKVIVGIHNGESDDVVVEGFGQVRYLCEAEVVVSYAVG